MKYVRLDDFHNEAMMHLPQVNTYAVVETETEHKGGQMVHAV